MRSWGLSGFEASMAVWSLLPDLGTKDAKSLRTYSKSQKVGSRIKDKSCWDSLCFTLRD